MIIKVLVIFGDFILLNATILFAVYWYVDDVNWGENNLGVYILINNFALLLGQLFFSTVIHLRMIGAGDIFRRIVSLALSQAVVAYVLLRLFSFPIQIGWLQLIIGVLYVFSLLLLRILERYFVRLYRESGRNTRTATFVGSDPELVNLY